MNNPRLGILLILLAVLCFSLMDGMSKYLGQRNDIMSVVMIRTWFFGLFALAWGWFSSGGIKAVAATELLGLQIFRGALLALQVCVIVTAFVRLGLAETHAIFACYPLLVVLLSIVFLGERVGWWRMGAIFVGCLGVLIIVQPGTQVFQPEALIAVLATFGFASYNVLTRYVGRVDSADTSFFWTGVSGAVVMTLLAPFFWSSIRPEDWLVMLMLCITSMLGHFLMIRALAVAEITVLQPFTMLQIVFASMIGLVLFEEVVSAHVFIGGGMIIASGLLAFWREAKLKHAPSNQ